jgi:hypothetical protein
MAALLSSLLSSVGIKAQMILLSPRSAGTTPLLPSTSFDHAIARVETGNGWQWVDATADQLPYGYLPYMDQGVPALIIDPSTTNLTISPVSEAETKTGKIDIDLSADGSMKGTFEGDYSGNSAWVMRSAVQSLGVERQTQLGQAMTGSLVPGSSNDSCTFDGTDTPDSDVILKLKYHEDNYAASAGSLLLLKLPWAQDFIRLLQPLEGPAPRTTPFELGLARGTEITTIHITLPAGYTPDSLEKPLKISSQWGECDFDFTADAVGITAKRTLKLDPMRIEVADIPAFTAFIKKADTESQKQIVIKSAN